MERQPSSRTVTPVTAGGTKDGIPTASLIRRSQAAQPETPTDRLRAGSNPPPPISPVTISTPISAEPSKKRVIRVYLDTQTRTMDISTLPSQTLHALYTKIFAKFNICRVPNTVPEKEAWDMIEREMQKWSLLVIDRPGIDASGGDINLDQPGLARLLREDEVHVIGTSASTNPDGIPSLFLRRRRLSKTPSRRPSQLPSAQPLPVPANMSKLEKLLGEEVRDLKMASGSSLTKSQSQPSLKSISPSASSVSVNMMGSQAQSQSARSNVSVASNQSTSKLMNFFGQRPPSEMITGNLTRFFPSVKSPPAGGTLTPAIEEDDEDDEEVDGTESPQPPAVPEKMLPRTHRQSVRDPQVEASSIPPKKV